MLSPSSLLLAGLMARAIATTIPVSVGRNGLTFEPNVIHAHEGDVIEFRFWPRNHSVVAGTFDGACRPASEGSFYSGFFPTQQGTVNVCSPPPPPCSLTTTSTGRRGTKRKLTK
jgi:plastocyanin